jgi:hypothetical protein
MGSLTLQYPEMGAPSRPASQPGCGLVGSALEIAQQRGSAESPLPELRKPEQEAK